MWQSRNSAVLDKQQPNNQTLSEYLMYLAAILPLVPTKQL